MSTSESFWSQRENSRKRLVQQHSELLKVQDALEHIIVTGAKARRDDWRRNEFQRKERDRSQHSIDCPPVEITDKMLGHRRKRRRKEPTVVCHAEDLRIYGRNGNNIPLAIGVQTESGSSDMMQHQQQQMRSQCDDSEWNIEHGDSVPPILFRMARLSQEYPSEEQMRRYNDPKAARMKSLQSTDITPDAGDIPRAIIERCWERAVHAASNAMIAPVATATTPTGCSESTSHHESGKRVSSFQFDMKTPLSQEACRKKCESLGIDIESLRDMTDSPEAGVAVSTTCPRCTRSFQTSRELHDHFYGNEAMTGCCRALIRPRHLDLIRSLLQNYLHSQTDQLWEVFLSQSAAGQTKDNTNNKKDNCESSTSDSSTDTMDSAKRKPQNLDWKDVRRFLENAVNNSTSIPSEDPTSSPRANPRHPVQESMQINMRSTANYDVNNESDSDVDGGGGGSSRSDIRNKKDSTNFKSMGSSSIKTTPGEDSNSAQSSLETSQNGGRRSLGYESPQLPLMLNPMILEAVERRLIDRYADVPR